MATQIACPIGSHLKTTSYSSNVLPDIEVPKEMAPVIQASNFIGGLFTQSDQFLESFNPATNKILAYIPNSSDTEVEAAIQAAKIAYGSWRCTSVSYRSQIMHKIADLIETNLEELAMLESLDQGKPIDTARKIDIPRAAHNFRFFGDAIKYQTERARVSETGVWNGFSYTSRSSVGVAALIAPWNLPLYLLTFKIAPCIAFGNTCVCKPSELTSLTAWRLCHILQEAGLPHGVVNIVFGYGWTVGNTLVCHPAVPIISFTGSTPVGELIRSRTASMHKKLSLELGGKNAAIVFGDSNLDETVNKCIKSSFLNQGEICLCTSRIFVQSACYDAFITKFVQKAREFTVGNPLDANTQMGALISRDHKNKVVRYIEQAVVQGGQVLCGHGVETVNLSDVNKDGNFVLPTVLTNVLDDWPCMQEEIFGPVTCIVPFEEEAEVIQRVNNGIYGLCASLYTKDIDRVHRVVDQLNVGTVWVNCWLLRDLNMPFGGCKASGSGREGFMESLETFTELKTVCIKI